MVTNPTPSGGPITIVSGLPRSGTSMMMRMLEAGGMPVLTDRLRVADENNPRGYYEFERVKKLKEGDTHWVSDARGKAVKVISALLEFLPAQYDYRIIFMQRLMDEILASQKRMLVLRGEATDKINDDQLADLFQKHLTGIKSWISQQPNIQVLYIEYNNILEDPQSNMARLSRFLSHQPLSIPQMLTVIEHSLYRQRQSRVERPA